MLTLRLTELRRNAGLTQQQLAERLHMRRDVYRRYEKGTYELPLWALVALSEMYSVTTDYILGLDTAHASFTK